MTDDPTRAIDTSGMGEPAGAPEAFDAAPTPADAVGVPVAAVTPQRSSRWRWVLGLGVAAVAVAVAFGGLLLLGARPTPEALRYIPGDSAVVVEARFDVPGDQLQHLGNLLAHFPGFKDQSTLDSKVDFALSRLFSAASEDGDLDYAADIKPWLNGPTFISAPIPPSTASSSGSSDRWLAVVTTTGSAACDTTFKDQGLTQQPYNSFNLSVTTDGTLACVIDGKYGLVGDPQSVRAGLDAKAAGTGMDKSEDWQTARAALKGDQLATIYIDGDAFGQLITDASDAAEADGAPNPFRTLQGPIAEWTIIGVRAEDDAIVLESLSAPVATASASPSLLTPPPAHASELTGIVPANPMLFIESQGAGVAIQNLFTQLQTIPELQEGLDPAIGMLEGLGGMDDLVGWIDDVGVVVLADGDTPSGGLFLVAHDEAGAKERVASLRTMLGLAGLGGGIEIEETTVNGVAVTTATITDLGALLPPDALVGGVVPSDIPPIELSLAVRGRVVMFGVGEGFMTKVLSLPAGSSLADDPAYKHALTYGLPNPKQIVYGSVPAAVELIEGLLPMLDPSAPAEWTEYKPYVEPFQSILSMTSTTTTGEQGRIVITLKQP